MLSLAIEEVCQGRRGLLLSPERSKGARYLAAAGEFCSQSKSVALRKAHAWIFQGHAEADVAAKK